MKGIISILVLSRHDEDRAKIITALSDQNDIIIAGVEKDEACAVIRAEHIKPDVLILNTYLPGITGHEIAPMIRRRSPSTSIIMICDNDEEKFAGLALKAGISGFLLKDTDTDKLIPVIKIIINGGCYISSSITHKVFSAVVSGKFSETRKHNISYSAAERRILTYMAQGYTDDEIAIYLNCSAGTVKNNVNAIKHRTQFRNRIQMAIFSLIYGLISLEHLDIFD
ncbi:MAG: response regulator transcription factor [Treponema sp.]|nr:response regulator transcription factor [Treponema sp.]MCL2273097.1 response regulator transcription factor [Treponema sp.]